MMPARLWRAVALVAAIAVLLGGCAGYYLQAAAGQAALMRARQPLEKVLADPGTAPTLRQQLLVVDAALVFARVELGLPGSSSYRHYADLKRPYVVWNVFAAPEFSLEPREWCYPIAGCTTYRGWFSEARALKSAAELSARGYDVFVGGVAAYSTLGWFDDPVLNTMLGDDETALAGLLFHELAHQLLYVPGDTLFNEGFATLVEEEGTRRWLASRNDQAGLCYFHLRQSRRAAALGILADLRTALAQIYATDGPSDERRQQRSAAFERARTAYAGLRAGWASPPWFDSWFAPGLNNARLAALSSYEELVPAFHALLARDGGDLARFYGSVAALGALEPEARERALGDFGRWPGAGVSAGPAAGNCP
ncbi:MAG: aminopeptidase [Chromatiales bacterium]|nr:aminopeptidase [Chromatiales bacterium]